MKRRPYRGLVGAAGIAVAADVFRDLADVLEDAEQLRNLIHAVPPATGLESVLAPGDPEHRSREVHREHFPVGSGTLQAICAVATKVVVSEEKLCAAVLSQV